MRVSFRVLSAMFTTLPSLFFGGWMLTISRGEYYRSTYLIMATIFFGTSLLLGLVMHTILQRKKFNYPWLWLFISGGLAWLIALFVLALLNFTPLCIGRDNGDGINDYSLCSIYSLLVALVYSPAQLVLLFLNAFIGGKILSSLYKRKIRKSRTMNPPG